MSDLKQEFDRARNAIESDYSHIYHYPLLEILRAVNPDASTTFNPDKLAEHGIDPAEFHKAWAHGFAKETLSQTGVGVYAEVTLSRCKICLSEEGDLAFGPVLRNDVKSRIQDRLNTLSEGRGPKPAAF